MKIHRTPIDGVWTVDAKTISDDRGLFYRAFCDSDLSEVLDGRTIRQVNVSRTSAVGAIRGMHFQQSPYSEMKLVRCLRGCVWDVALDLRQGSQTFMKWHAEELSSGNARMMIISEGCAHGFQVLEADSELLYLHTAPYIASAEGAVRYDDPMAGIGWPLDVTFVSQRDGSHSLLDARFRGLAS